MYIHGDGECLGMFDSVYDFGQWSYGPNSCCTLFHLLSSGTPRSLKNEAPWDCEEGWRRQGVVGDVNVLPAGLWMTLRTSTKQMRQKLVERALRGRWRRTRLAAPPSHGPLTVCSPVLIPPPLCNSQIQPSALLPRPSWIDCLLD